MQSLEKPTRRVPLLLVDRAVALEYLVDPRHILAKLLRSWTLAGPITRRSRPGVFNGDERLRWPV
jgi:hypothetical protein